MDILLLGREPVSHEQPAGADIRYDPVFDELQAEIEKLSSPSALVGVDWQKVVRLSAEILEKKSKDILVAGYLAVGLIYTQKIKGLSIGLQIYRDLLDHFWEDLFPPKTRMRARLGALEWWIEKSIAVLDQMKQFAFDTADLNLIKDTFEKIEGFLSQNVEEPPSFASIREFLDSVTAESQKVPEEAQSQISQTKDPGKGELASAETSKVRETEKPEALQEISSLSKAKRFLDEELQRIRRIAAYFLEQDLSNPLAYRLLRVAAWSSVEELPLSTDGLTKIPPPPARIKNVLLDFKDKGDYESLLRSAEERLFEFIFWIDLNRLISEAMTGLDSKYARSQEVVCQETASLIRRLPGIEDLSFSDGTPFADPETKQWLKGIAFGAGSVRLEPPAVTEAVSGTGAERSGIDKEILETQSLIKKGKLLEAAERFQQKLQMSFSQRDKLLWRLGFSQALINANQLKFSIPLLDQILKDIDRYRLEEYDPVTALQALKLAWVGFVAQSDERSRERTADILNRIARLDLGEVIRLGNAKVKRN